MKTSHGFSETLAYNELVIECTVVNLRFFANKVCVVVLPAWVIFTWWLARR